MSASATLNFTKTALEALPLPEAGRAVYQDAKAIGLQLRVMPSGVKTFSVFRRVKGGAPTRVTIGRFPDVSVEQARKQAALLNAELASGVDPATKRKAERDAMTFGTLFQRYLEGHSKVRKLTWQEDVSKYNQYLDKPLGKKRLSSVGRRELAKIHSDITAAGHGVTANRVHALVSSIFGWGVSVDLCATNPAVGIRKNQEHSRDRFLRGTELPAFFRALAAEPNETIRDFFLLALLTGARRSNVLEMKWTEIDLPNAEWRIGRTKNGTPQVVMLAPEAVTILDRRTAQRSGPFVLPGTGVSGHLVEPKKGWARILTRMAAFQLIEQLATRSSWGQVRREAEEDALVSAADPEKFLVKLRAMATEAGLPNDAAPVPDLRIHDLRRTLASWQLQTGASLSIVGKSLNHKSQATTAIYARLDTDPVRQSVNRAAQEMYRLGTAGSRANSQSISSNNGAEHTVAGGTDAT